MGFVLQHGESVAKVKNARFVGGVDQPEAWIDLEWFVADKSMVEAVGPSRRYFEVERPVRCLYMWSGGHQIDPPGLRLGQTIGVWGAGGLAALQYPG